MSKYIKHPISPCQGCTDRRLGCHNECDKYIKYKQDFEEWKQTTKPYKRQYVKESDTNEEKM